MNKSQLRIPGICIDCKIKINFVEDIGYEDLGEVICGNCAIKIKSRMKNGN